MDFSEVESFEEIIDEFCHGPGMSVMEVQICESFFGFGFFVEWSVLVGARED